MKAKQRIFATLLAATLCLLGASALAATPPAKPTATPKQFEAMTEHLAQLEIERGTPSSFWTIEEKYAFEQAYLHIFLAEPEVVCLSTLPKEDEPQQDAIMVIAEEAIAEQYGPNALHPLYDRKDCVRLVEYFTGERIWTIDVFLYEDVQVISIYHVTLDATDGTVLDVNAGENGHG